MKSPDVYYAIELYNFENEIGIQQIKKLYSCCDVKARKLKDEAFEEMTNRGRRNCLNAHVNTKIAFETWGIDIVDFEQRIKKIKDLGLKKSVETTK